MPRDLLESMAASEQPRDLLASSMKQPSESVSLAPSVWESVKNFGTAAVGGLAEGGADIVQGVLDTPEYILEKLGAISPETAKKLYQFNKESTDIFRSDYNPGDALSKAKEQFPLTHAGTKVAGDIAGMGVAMRAVPLLGQAAKTATSGLDVISPYIAQGAGLGARSAGMGLINQAGANPEDKTAAFALGAATQPLFEGIGTVASKVLSPRATAVLDLQQKAVQNKDATKTINALYSKVKDAPFIQDDQVQLTNVAKKVNEYVMNSGFLSPGQKSVLMDDIVSKLPKASGHDEVLSVYKSLGNKSNIFQGASDDVYNVYRNTRQELKQILDTATNRVDETQGILQKASDAANQQRILNKTFGNIINKPEEFSVKKASNTLDKEIEILTKNKGNPEMIQSLQGLNKLIREIPKAPTISTTAGAVAGGAAGYTFGVGGSVAGTLAGSALASYLNNFTKSEAGMKFLANIAKPSVTQQDRRNILKSLIMSAGEWFQKQANETDKQEPLNLSANTPQEVPVEPYKPGDSMNGSTTPLMNQWKQANPWLAETKTFT